jgi:Protein of unknown function (DUF2877)
VAAEPSITSIGARAARLLSQHTAWSIEAVFDRSFYIRCVDEFICIGDVSIGLGPLNALVAPESALPCIAIGRPLSLDISTAQVWHAPPWPTSHFTPEPIERVIQHALQEAPPESFMHLLFAGGEAQTALTRRARLGATTLQAGLTSGDAARFDEAASLLLGLGPGLTPSGDDVLSGALVMLFALRANEPAIALEASISGHMRAATSALSCAFLRAACDGEPPAALHQSVSALLLNRKAADVVSPLRSIGETSGFDMLAGMLLVAEIYRCNL